LKRVLVTGGAGFLGSHLVDRLMNMGLQVTAFDDLFRGARSNISQHFEKEAFTFFQGDVLDPATLRKAMDGVDTVYHLAAINGTRYFYEDPSRILDVNGTGTRNVLEAAADASVKRVVFTSSSEVYGYASRFPTPEDERLNLGPPTEVRWSYATSKVFGEHLCLTYGAKCGYETVILRYFNAYGPRLIDTPYGQVVAIFARSVLRGEPPVIHGDGKQTRSFMYVEDAVEGAVLAGQKEEAAGQIFNIGSQQEVTILQLAETIIELCGMTGRLTPVHVQALPADPKRRLPDTRKAKMILGYQAKVDLREGLQRTLQWLKEQETN